MAEMHEKIVRQIKNRLFKKGFIAEKSPTVSYRPDIFVRKYSKEKNEIIEELIIEVETQNTIFSEHTISQLNKMYEYLKQKRKYLKKGLLAVPYSHKSHAKNVVELLGYEDKIEIKGEKNL